ncbi:MAG: hypothetical protein ACM3TR_20355 [Caulobacteraceae bacterium]
MKKYILIPLLLAALILGLAVYPIGGNEGLELNSFKYKTPINGAQGSMKYELTFDNAVNKFSSNVVIGRVTDASEYDKNHDNVTVEVEEELVGQVEQKVIDVYAANYSLETDGRYMLFLTEHDSAVYPNKFYVLLNQFVIKIDDAENLLLLEDPIKKEYIPPFKDTKYNKLSDAKEYIEKIKDNNIFKDKKKKKVIDRLPDIKEQIDASDHIIELTASNVSYANAAKTIVSVDFTPEKIYKGGGFENINSILLPAGIEEEKTYLIFLVDNEDSISLATRTGSIIEVGTSEYEKALDILEK